MFGRASFLYFFNSLRYDLTSFQGLWIVLILGLKSARFSVYPPLTFYSCPHRLSPIFRHCFRKFFIGGAELTWQGKTIHSPACIYLFFGPLYIHIQIYIFWCLPSHRHLFQGLLTQSLESVTWSRVPVSRWILERPALDIRMTAPPWFVSVRPEFVARATRPVPGWPALGLRSSRARRHSPIGVREFSELGALSENSEFFQNL